MVVFVREASPFGPCNALGELIGETASRYIYRNRAGTAFVSKNSPSIHITPCLVCAMSRPTAGDPRSTVDPLIRRRLMSPSRSVGIATV